MKNSFKLFDFMGTPVYLKYWFFLFLLFGINEFIIFFISILIHELAHTYTAIKLKRPVENVCLDFLFGSAKINTDDSNYKDIILISIAGPLSNLVLFVISYLIVDFINSDIFIYGFLKLFLFYNLLMFIGNMLPIYPIDGGRIIKAICQWTTNPTIGRKISGTISIISSIILLIFSLYLSMYILSIFCLLFIYLGYNELKEKY
jgi:Zn-dependent protease